MISGDRSIKTYTYCQSVRNTHTYNETIEEKNLILVYLPVNCVNNSDLHMFIYNGSRGHSICTVHAQSETKKIVVTI